MVKFFIFLAISLSANARQVWIHSVGINEKIKAQNFPYFYQSAENFSKICKQATGPNECHLFINDDESLHSPAYESYPEKLTSNEGAPTEDQLKKTLKDTIMNARAGDTIIISLQNHGSPYPGKSASCIWLSSDNKICRSDLAEILKSKPAGVKVVINADGCFSEAFAELSSKEVCTVTSASRLFFGFTQSRDFWNALAERHPKVLADLREPIIAESGQQKLLGSQVILQQLCTDARKHMQTKDVISSLIAKNNSGAFNDPTDCRDADLTAKKLFVFSNQVLDILKKQGQKSCAEMQIPQIVCDAQKRLRTASPEIKNVIAKLMPISTQEDKNFDWAIKNHELLGRLMQQSSAMLKTLTPAELKEIADSFKLGITPNYSKMNPSHAAAAKAFFKAEKPMIDIMRSSHELEKKTDALTDYLKKQGYYEDLLMVQSCLLENEPVSDVKMTAKEKDDLAYFANISQEFPEKKFKEHDYEEARKCEESVSF